MMSAFVASLILIAFPVVVFTRRFSGTGSRAPQLLGIAVASIVVVAEFPRDGGTWTELRGGRLLVTASIVLLLVVQRASAGRVPRAGAKAAWLWLTVLAALLVYLNFFNFHGPRAGFVHSHEFAHYYLGSKYAAELRYPDIYAALLRAEAEDQDGQVLAREARDLTTDRLVPVNALATLGAEIEKRFAADRWAEFRTDALYFRVRLGLINYPKVVIDHGYNASPVWSLIGGSIANATSASDRTLRLLSVLDGALLMGLAAATALVLGGEALALTVIYVCIAFGAELGWVGGGYLRQMWFCGVIGFVLCLERGRYAWAGGLLAFAAMLRVFPAFFAIGLVGRTIHELLSKRRLSRSHSNFFVAFAATAGGLFLLSGLYPGFEAWAGFLENTRRHAERVGFNTLGLLQASAWLFGDELPAEESAWLEQMRLWREAFGTIHLVVVFAPAIMLALAAARRFDDVRAAMLGAPLLLCGLNLAGYYTTFMAAAVLAFRRRLDDLMWIFGAELVVHVLHLFEPENRTLHLYKTILLLYAFAGIYWPESKPASKPVEGPRA